ncbi:MAG: GtrA family protein [Gallionella sp.]|nr:GtrA family protein [Gallionella sp.]
MKLLAKLAAHPLPAWFFKKRFIRFGTVGASGIVVNLGVLYLCQELLFVAISSPDMRLNVSLATAIFFATVNNFYWNRRWTWSDRTHRPDKHLILHFGQYALACWVGIVMQVILTKLFVVFMHYLIANALAIVLASVFNFLVNNFWTFRSHKPVEEIALPNIPEIEPDIENDTGGK